MTDQRQQGWAGHLPRAVKDRARARLIAAVRRGQVIKPTSCERCPATDLPPREMHAHHPDYTKPLEVEWLCRSCHVEHHRRESREQEAARKARLRDKRYRINQAW